MAKNLRSKMLKEKTTSRIIGIQFSMLSPDEIRKNSVVEITSRDTYINNKPCIGGLFDPRMGVLEPGTICPTDGMIYIDTPGYFGHIELARPVFFIQHLKEIMKICRCVCFKCSKLLINKSQHNHILERSGEDRWDYVSALAIKIKRCGQDTEDGCGYKQPDKIKLEGMSNIIAIWEKLGELKLTPEIILKIFKRISNDDVFFMGFNPLWSRPEWMICTVLPVPPPAVRPSVKHDAQQRSEDDLTHIYSNIIKYNNNLKERLSSQDTNSYAIEVLTTMLQHSVAVIVNNKIKGVDPMAQRSGRPYQCIMTRINSKYGRIRGNLMGKRVDYSARSVITGDPNLSMKQSGVPLKIAKNLTKPVTVNDMNRDFLMMLVQHGPDVWPGAKILERKNGENISLRYVDRKSVVLENGDIVHRHMMDGDVVLFNRQPSLHRASMMGHIAKIMKVGDSFRMNVANTKPYNADFDGDEMNLHIPQNVITETELRHLAATPYQIINPGSNKPIIGIFQDSLLGSYRFTRKGINFTPLQAMDLLMMYPHVQVDELRRISDSGERVTNFDVLSQIMPPLTIKYKTGLYDESEDQKTSNNVLEIRAGKYMRGQLEKGAFDSATKGILHRICNDFGNMACADFNDNMQNVVTEFMKTSSFSVGISDLIADRKTNEEIAECIKKQKMEVQTIIDKVHLGIFENKTANSNMVQFEQEVSNILNKATEHAGKIGKKSLSRDNRFLMIVESGSKGNLINISQMISCLGQQSVDGKRISYGFDDRTLPHFKKYDDSPNARGFVENSYITGLTAPELFFHAMAGRTGLIDTAVKTSSTGYIQRRLVKGLEDLMVNYDMTVRNNKGKIIQFQYGDDNFDAAKVENQILPLIEMSIEDIYMWYDLPGLSESENTLRLSIFTKPTIARMNKQQPRCKETCLKYTERLLEARDLLVDKVLGYQNEKMIRIPVAFQYIIANIQGQLHLDENSAVDITPLEAFDMIETYFGYINSIPCIKTNRLVEIAYYYYLNPRDLLVKRRFHEKGLKLLLETILLKFKEAIIHPGEMVGVVAAQSIGEPSTQLTLNTFHSTGIASKTNVTRGVPRIEEILRLTKNPKNPSMTVYLHPQEDIDNEKANKYAVDLAHTKLVDVVKSIQIYFDPHERCTQIQEDRVLLEQYYQFENMIEECIGASPDGPADVNKSKWVIRMEMEKETMIDKNITMDDIHFAISNSHYGKDVQCIFSDYNMDNLVFRIRTNANIFDKKPRRGVANSLDQSDDIYLLKNFQDALLNQIVLRGINGIQNVLPRKLQNMVVKEEGKYVRKDTWVLDSTGSNLLDTLALDYIDATRTTTNDIKEVFDVLGIEAARKAIHTELVDVMAAAGASINYHHTSLLCDRMTCNKDMVSIFRSGLLNDDVGPIAKATFEVHTEVFLGASRHAEFDHMKGVSANIMCGQQGNYGTNAFQLVLDMKAFDSKKSQPYQRRDITTDIEEGLTKSKAADDTTCGTNLEIQNNIANIKHTSNNMLSCMDDGYEIGF